MIVRGSRYESALLVKAPLPDGSSRYAVYQPRTLVTQTLTFSYRTLFDGERLDMLAQKYYGNPLLWWAIARANPEVMYPDDIPAGTVLRIPDASAIR